MQKLFKAVFLTITLFLVAIIAITMLTPAKQKTIIVSSGGDNSTFVAKAR